ncbi:hypothetical protein GCM10008959_06310 [Deinococcus seoulensis]|uniref:Uncharacterized protein n=2 Tax=Deinococcus TaxID=1298 RepID=A0ABQ2RMQ5_9DEIO|nr:hypothetical protein GCM10008959_06310 [Deinococcus seoulensis]GGS16258.1 hypothetical protein GCM10008961_04750 [Deinococcus knuensis]
MTSPTMVRDSLTRKAAFGTSAKCACMAGSAGAMVAPLMMVSVESSSSVTWVRRSGAAPAAVGGWAEASVAGRVRGADIPTQ